jgi:hypothetical protein
MGIILVPMCLAYLQRKGKCAMNGTLLDRHEADNVFLYCP